MGVYLGPVGIGYETLPIQSPGNMFAFELRRELSEIHADQIVRQAIDRRLERIVAQPAAANFRFVIAGEQALATQPVRREILFEKAAGVVCEARADFLPIARVAGIVIDGLVGGFPGDNFAAAAKCGQGRLEVGALPSWKLGKCCDGQTRRRFGEPPGSKRRQQQRNDSKGNISTRQGRAPLVATKVQVGLEAPIGRAKVQTSVTSRWT
jgi:hypothetical protein